MLKQRVITALVLLAILLPAMLSSDTLAFNAIVLLMLSLAGWEWGRLNGLRMPGAVCTGLLVLVAGLGLGYSGFVAQSHTVLWLAAGGVWVLGSAALIKSGVPGWEDSCGGTLGCGRPGFVGGRAGHRSGACHRYQLLAVGAGAGVGSRHICLLCRPCLWPALYQVKLAPPSVPARAGKVHGVALPVCF